MKSRAGLQREADVLLDDDTEIPDHIFEGCHCLLVDEVRMQSRQQRVQKVTAVHSARVGRLLLY